MLWVLNLLLILEVEKQDWKVFQPHSCAISVTILKYGSFGSYCSYARNGSMAAMPAWQLCQHGSYAYRKLASSRLVRQSTIQFWTLWAKGHSTYASNVIWKCLGVLLTKTVYCSQLCGIIWLTWSKWQTTTTDNDKNDGPMRCTCIAWANKNKKILAYVGNLLWTKARWKACDNLRYL